MLILDADKGGFMCSKTNLIQIAGWASRNVNGQAILYAILFLKQCINLSPIIKKSGKFN